MPSPDRRRRTAHSFPLPSVPPDASPPFAVVLNTYYRTHYRFRPRRQFSQARFNFIFHARADGSRILVPVYFNMRMRYIAGSTSYS